MSCRGSWGHLFVYTILHKQRAVNHLRCRRGDADLHHNGGGSARIKHGGQMPFHFALAFQSVLMPAIFFFPLPPPRHRCRCLVLCCTCSSSPAPACQPWKKKNKKKKKTAQWAGGGGGSFAIKDGREQDQKLFQSHLNFLSIVVRKVLFHHQE